MHETHLSHSLFALSSSLVTLGSNWVTTSIFSIRLRTVVVFVCVWGGGGVCLCVCVCSPLNNYHDQISRIPNKIWVIPTHQNGTATFQSNLDICQSWWLLYKTDHGMQYWGLNPHVKCSTHCWVCWGCLSALWVTYGVHLAGSSPGWRSKGRTLALRVNRTVNMAA